MVDLSTALPQDFTVGVGTSAWQVEGAVASRGRTIWDDFADVPGAIVDGSRGDPACEHVARMESDVALLGWLGVDAYRFSISWARVQPGGRGPISVAGLDHYDRLCDALLEQGITPLVTLYHWDLPSELHDAGGWLDPDTGELFGLYANAVASRLGDRVGSWATLNEPWCTAFLGHAAGIHAPGRHVRRLRPSRSPTGSWWPTRGGWRACGRRGSRNAGIVLNLMPTFPDDPYRDDPALRQAARHIDGLQNHLWLDALAGRGISPGVMESTADITDWSFVTSDEETAIGAPLDWLGVNYYTVQRLVPCGWLSGAGRRPGVPGASGMPACALLPAGAADDHGLGGQPRRLGHDLAQDG